MRSTLAFIAISSLASIVAAAPAPRPQDVPAPALGRPYKEVITLTGDIILPDDFLFDTDQQSSLSSQAGFGVDYIYKCGGPSTKGAFNALACAKMINPTNNIAGCTDTFLDPFGAESGNTKCVADGSTGLTIFNSFLQPEEDVGGQSTSNACGFLGGRCGDNYENAMLYIVGPTGGARSVDLKRNGHGMVKIYNT